MRQVSVFAAGCVVAWLCGCGYGLAHAPTDPAGPFAVARGRVLVASAVAVSAAEAGARAELARAGQLARCDPHLAQPLASRCTALVVDVVRIDEHSAGVAVTGQGPSAYPLARALRIIVTGRAYLLRDPAARPERDTGDMSTTEIVARSDDPAVFAGAREDAVRFAAKRLGARLARRLLGFPE